VLKRIIKILSLVFCIVFYNNIKAQCTVTVDVANLQHVNCPNGGAVGSASITQDNYSNYFWENITTGQILNSQGNTTLSNLDAGLYVIYATDPYNSCSWTAYSDTFEILEAVPFFQFNPTQACPSFCNVLVSSFMQVAISGVSYTYQFDSNPIVSLPNSLTNQCGGLHTYEIFANGIACGIENIGISQFAQMNLATSVINPTCIPQGSATVNITGVGASAISTYCDSEPQQHYYTTIDNVLLLGNTTSISNNTTSIPDMYTDFTSFVADVNPGSSYNLTIDLGKASNTSAHIENIANVYVDWNIDGDFNDINELVAQVAPTLSPSSHTVTINVPLGAIPGQSRMRIVAQNYQYQPSNQALPCDYHIAYFGSTEDYTLVVSGSVATPVSYLWSDGQTTATANNLGSGNYTVTITDANGCSATDTAIVSSWENITVIADSDQTICNGGIPINLTATASSSVGAYSWSPSSSFINPNLQNPNFNSFGMNATSVFTVIFTDSNGCLATDSVTITVNSVPTVTILSALPNPACLGNDITLTASTSIPVNGFRFQYNNGGGWINMTNPQMVNTNPITFNNIVSTTQFRVKVREYAGCESSPWSPVITVPISIISTQPINHN
tara:strand:+ start:1414 stop:3258 length:1845 start_codon:yes stop_codon:yes gene_type:complete